jgi:hypothetical protein
LKIILLSDRTVAIECCYQNIGIATSLALTMFEDTELTNAMGVPFMYGVCEMVFVGIYCLVCWKAGWTKAPSDASIWNVLFTTYEVLEVEMAELNGVEISISESTHQSHEKTIETEENGILTHYFDFGGTSSPEIPSEKVPTVLQSFQTAPHSACV